MDKETGIQLAVKKFDGSPTKLAAAIASDAVLRQHIEHWLKAGRVPVLRCALVSAATGIPCEQLNPDVDWAQLRAA